MIEITRRFEFDAAHRVYGHEGKCANLHGHRYVALVTVRAEELDSLGRVIDFSEIKSLVGTWIDKYWDHNTLLNSNDPLYLLLAKHKTDLYPDNTPANETKDPYPFSNINPTAENIARSLMTMCNVLFLDKPYWVVKVQVFETPNCSATVKVHKYERPTT